jgi:hypothetical protein
MADHKQAPAPRTMHDFHLHCARTLFNHVWTLMEKERRTADEDDEMIHAAHASRYHWGQVGEPVNFARGEWQVSRVYTMLNRSEPALYHARRCLDHCAEGGLGGFDLAFAHEALARAYATGGMNAEARRSVELAREAGTTIEDEEDRQHFLDELATVPMRDG